MPFEYARLKLNRSEWVNQFGSSVEGVLHLLQWKNGLDLRLVGGMGWVYLTEGSISDRTASFGLTQARVPVLRGILQAQTKSALRWWGKCPFATHIISATISANGTSVLALPIRISVQVGF